MTLYAWQQDCLAAWEANGCRGIVRAVTGAGKTVLSLAAMDRLLERFPDLRVKVVVPTIPLAQQWKTALLHRFQEERRPGFFGGGSRDAPDRPTMIYILNSARGALAAHIRRDFAMRRHVLLICDECHHCQSPQNRRIFDFLTEDTPALYSCIGLSATPFGIGDDAVLTRALGTEIYRYGFGDAEEAGVVSPFSVCEVSAPFLPEELTAYGALTTEIGILTARLYQAHPGWRGLERDRFLREVSAVAHRADMDPEDPAAAFLLKTFERKELSSLARARVQCGLALLDSLSPSDRVLVFCERIGQAADMASAVRRRWGNVCGLYHSGMSTEARARVLREFREGRSRILVSCRCLDEGLDVPDANVGIVLSGAAAERQRVQRLGRVIRTHPGKDAACLYYIYIRESADDAAYLPGLETRRIFHLRYFPAEDTFSDDLYEYAAACLLERARARQMAADQLAELRRCLTEGLPRADRLLGADVLAARASQAQSVHERNYWNAMRAIGRPFRGET